jgi:type I restriction enzyme, S subunit
VSEGGGASSVRWVKLGDVCTIVNGATPKTSVSDFWDGPHPWITPAEMAFDETPYRTETRRTLSEAGLQSCSASLLPPNSVVLSARAPIGHLVINTVPMATNQGCKGLVPSEAVHYEYLYHFLAFNRERLNQLGTGATFLELSAAKLKAVTMPLPSLEDQRRIVTKLDRAFAEIDRAIENTEQAMQKASNVLIQFLDNIFSGPDFHMWQRRTVSEIADHKLGKMLDKNKNRGEFQPYLRNLNVRWFEFDLDDVLAMKVEKRERERYSVLPGDLMICEGGYPGRCAIWNVDQPMYFQKAIHRVRPHDSRHTEWIQYWLFYLDSTDELRQYFTGAGIQHLTGKALAALPIPVPPPEQAEPLSHRADAIRREVENLRTVYHQKLTALRTLKQSILAETFSFREEVTA